MKNLLTTTSTKPERYPIGGRKIKYSHTYKKVFLGDYFSVSYTLKTIKQQL